MYLSTISIINFSFIFTHYCASAFSTSRSNNSNRLRPKTSLTAFTNFLEGLSVQNLSKPSPTNSNNAEDFISALNEKRFDDVLTYVDDDIEFIDTDFPSPFEGKDDFGRIQRLAADVSTDRIVVDEIISDSSSRSVGLLFHTVDDNGDRGKIGNACFDFSPSTGLITKIFFTKESSKSGESNLQILKAASQIIASTQEGKKDSIEESEARALQKSSTSEALTTMTLPEQYFAAWNERDIEKACSVFADNVEYDDTAFPEPFTGKEALERHLNTCVKCFPPSMSFVVDDTINGGDNLMLRWHAENNDQELPFTRGCSFYKVKQGKIVKGVDVVEPAVFKTGGVSLLVKSVLSEPIRLVPMAVWATYMYVVFFSDWFYGQPATALEQRTWEEVRDLSLNFFFVSPLLNLPFAPVVHPMMEGVFNLLLSWAALFAGFLSDERRDKPNLLPMLPMVAGMQFLTSAFLLPFLASRSNEKDTIVYKEDLSIVAQATESRLLGVAMAGVGTGSFFWAAFARMEDFGGLSERLSSFLELLSIDRVGSSFLVDFAIFAAFQGWLVEDDLKRRNMASDNNVLVAAAKYIPFFGLAAYLTFRDPLPSRDSKNPVL